MPLGVGATTINKMCGSGMKAAMMAHDLIRAGSAEIVVAGGMESMTNAPYLLDRARAGYRIGHGKVTDSMFLDGLEDAYDKGRLMGTFAEDCAQEYQFTREAQDAFALASLERANRAMRDGAFADEIVPVKVRSGKAETSSPPTSSRRRRGRTRSRRCKPAFRDGGTVTAANSSSISDGAAALVLMRESEAERRGLTPLARIVGHSTHAAEPAQFPTAPVGAMRKLFEKTGWSSATSISTRSTKPSRSSPWPRCATSIFPHDKVNVNGGACALGHPIGASGARILVDSAGGAEGARPQARRRLALHRRRRGDGDGGRTPGLK